MVNSTRDLESLALKIFHIQYQTNNVYRKYCELIGTNPDQIDRLDKIPFLPIQFFKKEKVQSRSSDHEMLFMSSGTGGERSKHYIQKIDLYERSFKKAFKHFYADPSDYVILALLPSYLEQGDSSLVYMCNSLIEQSNHSESCFILNEEEKLNQLLDELNKKGQKTLLIGVSFALLDFIEKYPQETSSNLIVMETGGMKGRKKELVRDELHGILCKGFSVDSIHSEYGMTELLSQAYSKSAGMFQCPPWMRVMIRKQEDPFSWQEDEKVGGINIIDLANLYSCSFIQTDDLGRISKDQFEVIGRFDNAEIRGCSQMAI